MVEIEIRGTLTKEEFDKANSFFATNGILKEVQDREMILLLDTLGYDSDPTKREVDIRIRCTNGKTELMVKKKVSENNVARSEKAFDFGDMSLDDAKELVKSFGSVKGQWMHRKKNVYDYDGVEWSLVEAVPGVFYYEAEMVAEEGQDMEKIRKDLMVKAQNQGYSVLEPEEYRRFIEMLGSTVNRYIDW